MPKINLEYDFIEDFKEEVFNVYVSYLIGWRTSTLDKDKLARMAFNMVINRKVFKFNFQDIHMKLDKEEYIKYLISFDTDELIVLERV